jgi:hypothetical protein
MIVLDNSWKPSTFYDKDTTLYWIHDYKLYKKIKENKVKEKENIKYAINKDVKKAFDELYKIKTKNMKKTKKK